MMNKNFLIFILLLFSCSDNIIEVIVEKHSNGIYKVVHYYNNKGQIQQLFQILTYYNDGHIEYEKNYKENKLEGKLYYYYDNGQINYEENYIAGVREGKWISYTRDGKIQWEDNYMSGKIDTNDQNIADTNEGTNVFHKILW